MDTSKKRKVDIMKKNAIKTSIFLALASLITVVFFIRFHKDVNELQANSENYNFTVLELVPAERYATFGYTISGQEPINIANYQNDVDSINAILEETNLLKSTGYRDIPIYILSELTPSQMESLGTTYETFNQVGFYKRGENGTVRYTPIYLPTNETMAVRYDKYLGEYVENVDCGNNHIDVNGDSTCDNCFRNIDSNANYEESDDVLYYVYEKTTSGYDVVKRTSPIDVFDFSNEKYEFFKKDTVDSSMVTLAGSTTKVCKYIVEFKKDANGEWSFYSAHKAKRYSYENGVFETTASNVPSEFYTQYYFASNSNIDTGDSYLFKSSQLAVEGWNQSEYIDHFELTNSNLFETFAVPNKNAKVIVKRFDKVTIEDVNSADLIVFNTGNHSEVLSTFYDNEHPTADKIFHNYTEVPSSVVNAILNRLASQDCTIFYDNSLDTQSVFASSKLYSAVNFTYPNIAKKMNLMSKNNLEGMRNFVGSLTSNYNTDYALFGIDNFDLSYDEVAKHNVLSFKNNGINILTDFATRRIEETSMTEDVFEHISLYKGYLYGTEDDEKFSYSESVRTNSDVRDSVDNCINGRYVTPVFCLNYLLNAQKTTPIVDIPTLRVLEIEPCNRFYEEIYWNCRMFGIDPYYTGDVEVTRMSSRQFIGDKTNIYDNYDIVYFGAIYEDMNYEAQNANSTGLVTLNKTTTIPYTTFGVTGSVQATLPYYTYYAFEDGTCSPRDDENKHTAKITLSANNYNLVVECEGTYGLFTQVPITLNGKVCYLNAVYTSTVATSGFVESISVMGPFGETIDTAITANQFGFLDANEFDFGVVYNSESSASEQFHVEKMESTLRVTTPSIDTGNIASSNGEVVGTAKYGSNVSIEEIETMLESEGFVGSIENYPSYNFEYFVTKNGEELEKEEIFLPAGGYVETTNFDIQGIYTSGKTYEEIPENLALVDREGCLSVTKQLNMVNNQYLIEVGSNYNVTIFEFNEAGEYITQNQFSNGNVFTPNSLAKSIGIVLTDKTNANKTAEEWFEDLKLGKIGLKIAPTSSNPLEPPYDKTIYTWAVPSGVETILCKSAVAMEGYEFKVDNSTYNVKYVVVKKSTGKVVGYITNVCVSLKKDLRMFAYPTIYATTVNDIVTVYNDESMNGLLYYHTGDKLRISGNGAIKVQGTTWLSNETQYQRFGGNDISSYNYEDLVNFAKKGKLIMFAGTFYNENGKINTSKIDSMSWIYQLTQNKDITVYDETKLTNFNFETLVYTEFELNVVGAPLTYRDVNLATWGTDSVSFTGYDNAKDLGKTTYSYDELDMSDPSTAFYIKNRNIDITFNISQLVNDDATYYVKLYADSISDGQFTSDEEISSITIYDEEGNRVRYNNLKPNENYRIHFTVADNLNGIVHWQLRLYKIGEDSNYKQAESYFALYCAPEDAKNLNILQIGPNTGETFNLKTNEKFNRYVQAIKEYNIVVFHAQEADLLDGDVLKNEIFTKQECEERYEEYNGLTGRNAEYDRHSGLSLQNFDMIVLGYADYKVYATQQATLDAILAYIKSGKAVLMTHDNIDFNASTSGSAASHLQMNKYFRTEFGQDRFGINARPSAPVWSQLGTSSDETYWKLHDYDIDSFSNTMRSLGFDYSAVNGEYSQEGIAGFTDGFLIRIAKPNESQLYPFNMTSIYSNVLTKGVENGIQRKAKCLNEGQISNYPYRIGEIISTGQTHCQYFQLNMENENITAWYCLYEPNKTYTDIGGTSQKNTVYASPNDAANNFYIYSNKNLTYTGVGHASDFTDDELKLFVNTLVLSYRASAVTPEIEISNKNVDVYDKNVDLYLDYDVVEPTKLLDSMLVDNRFKIEFSTTQAFAGTNINNYVQFVDKSGNVLPFPIYSGKTNLPMETYTDESGSVYYKLDNSDSWYFDIPIDDINNTYGFDFDDVYQYAFKFNLLTTYGVENLNVTDSYDVHVIKRSLFNMH